MREIKFRGKRIDNGEWVYGLFARAKIGSLIVPAIHREREWDYGDYVECLEVDGETIGQYTGLKDRNGKEICEWDIVEITHPKIGRYQEESRERGRIVFDQKRGQFAWEEPGTNVLYGIVTDDKANEVIGNIHDNPEILGGESHV